MTTEERLNRLEHIILAFPSLMINLEKLSDKDQIALLATRARLLELLESIPNDNFQWPR